MTQAFRKTDAGLAEIKSRGKQLDPKLRTLLIMVDGKMSGDDLARLGESLGAGKGALDLLSAQGLIEAIQLDAPAASAANAPQASGEFAAYAQGQRFMNEVAKDTLGLKAFLFVLKVERCMNSADLIALLDDFEKAVTRARGMDYGAMVRQTAEQILTGKT